MDYSRNVKILVWQGFFIGFSLWTPIAAIYFSHISGSYLLGLSIFTIANFSGALFEIPTGIFSDLIGRKYTTMLGGLSYTLSGIVYAIGGNYWWLVAGAILGGLGRSFYSGNNEALLYDSLNKSNKKEHLEKWIGHIGGAEQWALGISAVIGGILASQSFSLVMWLSVIPLFLCFITSFWLEEIQDSTKKSTNALLHLKEVFLNFKSNKKLNLLSSSEIIGFGLGEASFQFTPVFVAGLWPLWAIGISRMLSNIAAAIGFNFSGKILKRFKPVYILLFEQIYSKITNLLAFVFPSVVSPLLLSSTSLLYGPSTVAQSSLMQHEFTDRQRATMGSLNSFGKSVFYGLAIIWLGWMADLFGPINAMIWGQIAGLVSVWLTFKLFRSFRSPH